MRVRASLRADEKAASRDAARYDRRRQRDAAVDRRVRPYRPTDLESLLEMYEGFDPEHCAQGLPPRSPTRRENWLVTLLDDGVHFVAEYEERIVGHGCYTPASDPEPELAVFVDPRYHDRGIGTALCERVISAAVDAGRRALVLSVERRNRPAVHLYRKLGFETVDHHGRELRMRLPLSEPGVTGAASPSTAES